MELKKGRRLVFGEEGVAAVEFAILLPVLILILFGTIEFGLLLFNKQVITNAAREGARAGIVAAEVRLDEPAIVSIVDAYCGSNMINFGEGIPVTTVTWTDNNGDGSATGFGDDLRVQVTFNYSFLVLSNLGFGDVNILSAAVMRME